MKKKILIVVLSLILISAGIQLYRYYKYDGNVLIYICNDSNLENIDVAVYLDGVKQVSDSFSNKVFHGYRLYPVKTTIGQHTLEVKSEKHGIAERVTFRVFTIRGIIIEVAEKLNSSENLSEYEFLIALQHRPLTWID